MFSGIIESIGTIERIQTYGSGLRLYITSSLIVAPTGEAGVGTSDRQRIGLGDSIAVFGVCLTVEEVLPPNTFVVVCGQETVRSSILGTLHSGASVHLERALMMGDRLDGHLVQGHVDGVGILRHVEESAESWIFWFEASPDLLPYIAVKGSICINGVSLTVNDIQDGAFRVNIIPHTIKETLFANLKAGDGVNLEVDVLARYIERMLSFKGDTSANNQKTIESLRAWGHGASSFGRSGG